MVHPEPAAPLQRRKVALPLPARMRRSSWFVGPSCRDVAMFIPGLALLLHIDFHRERRRRRGEAEPAARATPCGRHTLTHSLTHRRPDPCASSDRKPRPARLPPPGGETPPPNGRGGGGGRLGWQRDPSAPRPDRKSRRPERRPPPARPEGHLRLGSPRGPRRAGPRQEEAHFTLCRGKACNCPRSGPEPWARFSSGTALTPGPAAVNKGGSLTCFGRFKA